MGGGIPPRLSAVLPPIGKATVESFPEQPAPEPIRKVIHYIEVYAKGDAETSPEIRRARGERVSEKAVVVAFKIGGVVQDVRVDPHERPVAVHPPSITA